MIIEWVCANIYKHCKLINYSSKLNKFILLFDIFYSIYSSNFVCEENDYLMGSCKPINIALISDLN